MCPSFYKKKKILHSFTIWISILIKITVYSDLRDFENEYEVKIPFYSYQFYFVNFVNNIKCCFLQE